MAPPAMSASVPTASSPPSEAIAKKATDQIVKLYESCDEVWACSEETGETLRSYGYTKPYFVMPNGTDVSVPENGQELNACRPG